MDYQHVSNVLGDGKIKKDVPLHVKRAAERSFTWNPVQQKPVEVTRPQWTQTKMPSFSRAALEAEDELRRAAVPLEFQREEASESPEVRRRPDARREDDAIEARPRLLDFGEASLKSPSPLSLTAPAIPIAPAPFKNPFASPTVQPGQERYHVDVVRKVVKREEAPSFSAVRKMNEKRKGMQRYEPPSKKARKRVVRSPPQVQEEAHYPTRDSRAWERDSHLQRNLQYLHSLDDQHDADVRRGDSRREEDLETEDEGEDESESSEDDGGREGVRPHHFKLIDMSAREKQMSVKSALPRKAGRKNKKW